MQKVIIGTALAFTLTACGGGTTGPSYVSKLKTYTSDGSAIAIATNVPGGSTGSFNVTMLLANPSDGDKIVDALKLANDGDPKLYLVSATRNAPFYTQRQEGTNSNGESVVLVYNGENLPSGGYVSLNVIGVGSTAAIATDGSRLASIPIGTFSYTGTSSIIGGIGNVSIEDGTFTMQANFNTMSADISAQSANKYFTGNNLTIDSTTGKFQGTGTIGITSVNSAASTVVGYFAGTAAEGVHGATYQNADVPNGMAGVFYGSR